ncbi:enoyl-CoA hydratase-related protein [Bdellovibrio sp. 22V]|uniref:enoyl-CoA hydratase-related protein n=1 Tax=Bdellovibrio TaxID=958 RepID=UPI002542ABA2|nr:enoyl-CoA hydratase-related protein [Bdellovibrio sp. 22V]WII72338.1 enoyl-CoA hydratase-related protein [Bdellovibrio sp. 22V]
MDFYSQKWTHLKTQLNGTVLWLTLDNAEQSNAISLEMVDSLTRVLKHADFDPAVRVIVIKGEGTSFCAGGDIKAMQNKTGMFAGEGNELRMRYIHGIQQIPKCIEELSTPVIAMVNGPAIGAGCDLAMMCDLRIGTTKSKFGETFVKLGLVPGDGGTFFLQRVIGFSKAMQMSLTGDLVAGDEAQRWGLLNYFVDEADLENETQKLAEKIANNAPIAVQMTKKAMKMAYLNDLHTILDLSAAYQGITQRTEDHFTALQAMKDKRVPEFKGS